MKFHYSTFVTVNKLFNHATCSTNFFVAKHITTDTKSVEPVKLSYATYESTSTQYSKDISPLIILHGLFGSKSNWNSLCKVYQTKTNPQRKILAVDARNHGDSTHADEHTYAHMAADIKSLIEQLNFSKVILMGHSMGGRTMMYFALKYPELVERLVIADISPITTSSNLYSTPSIFKALGNVKLPSNVPMSQARSDVDNQLSSVVTEKPLRSFLLTNLVQTSSGSYQWRINIPVLLTHFNHIARFPLVNNAQYNGPVLFVGGGKSDYINKSDFPDIQKMFPKAEMIFIPGAGHLVHSDKPQEFLNITLDFLNKQ